MIKKQKLVYIFLFLLGIFASFQASASSQVYINNGIQKIIDAHREKSNVPGIQVSVSFQNETPRDFVSGTTTLNGSVLVTPEHLFQIGSETKSFVAAILLQLENEGLVSIEDAIGQWLPQLPSGWQKITIKQLLNHTSGIYNYTDSMEFGAIVLQSNFRKQWLDEELIQFAIKKPLYFTPGKGWHYSNTNYILAGMIIETITHKLVEDQIKSRLTDPLQLSNTYYIVKPYTNDFLKRMAHGYYQRTTIPIDVTHGNMSMAAAAGAIVSTSNDTAIWLRALLASDSILDKSKRAALMEIVDLDSGQATKPGNMPGYGLGLIYGGDYYGEEAWGHFGSTLGYLSNMLWLKCRNVVVTSVINHGGKIEASRALLDELVQFIQSTDEKHQCDKIASGSSVRHPFQATKVQEFVLH